METITIQKNKLPEGWEIKTLDEISLIKQYGYTCPASNVPKGPRLLRITDMDDEGDFNSEPKVYSNLSLHEAKKYLLEKGDILIARTGEPGKASMFNDEESAIFASYLIRFRINSKIIFPKLVLYFLRTGCYFDQIIEKTSETTQKNVNATKLGQIKIPLPPLPIQHQIVSKLDAFFEHYNKLKEEKQKAKEKYEQILQSAIASLIPQKELPEGWKRDKLVNLCSQKPQYGYTAKSVKEEVGPIYLRITDIDFKGKIDWENVKYVDIPENEYKKFKLEQGDILVARTGATVGKSYLYDGNKDMVFASYLIRFRSNSEVILPEYLIIYLQSSLYWHYISKEQSGTGQPNVNAKKLGDLEIIYPEKIRDQEDIIKKIKEFNENIKIFSEEQKNIDHQLSQLPKSVLSKAFKGGLT